MRFVILFDILINPSMFLSPNMLLFPFHLLFPLYPALIIGIFYCLNYTSLLLDLIITHLAKTFYNTSTTGFVLISQLEKDHSMICTRRLKNVVIFFQTILSFVLSRKIIYIYNDIAQKHGNVTVKDFRKYEKLKYKQNKLKLDINFLNNWCVSKISYLQIAERLK